MKIYRSGYGAMFPGLMIALLIAGGWGIWGGVQPVMADEGDPLDLSFRPDRESLTFSVMINSEYEMRGTSMINTLSYRWTAKNWVRTDSSWTADVVFSKIKSMSRRGTLSAGDRNKAFDKLEGLVLVYELFDGKFEPVRMPTKEPKYMAMLEQLKSGVNTIGLEDPGEPMYPGGKYEIVIPAADRAEFAEVTQDSIVTLNYKGDEKYLGRRCAKLQFRMKQKLDGIVEQKGERAKIKGKIEVKGDGMWDLERGFLLKLSQKNKTQLKQQLVDKRGRGKGSEQAFTQNVSISVSFLEK